MNTEKNKDVKKEENVPAMNRREALKKTGYAAFSAATMMVLLNKPDKAMAGPSVSASPSAPASGRRESPTYQRRKY
jgi:hypothetical protein